MLIKTNSQGATLWSKTYGGQANDIGKDIIQTSDGGYIITGSTMSYGNQSEIILLKLNAAGKAEDIIGQLTTSSGN